MFEFIEYSKTHPPSEGEYFVAIYYQNGKKLFKVIKYDGKKFATYNDNISHWSLLPVHPVLDHSEQRRRDWAKSVYEQFKDKYPIEMLREFCRWWGELQTRGKHKGKMKWETKDTFETKLRLGTWKRNQDKFEKENEQRLNGGQQKRGTLS